MATYLFDTNALSDLMREHDRLRVKLANTLGTIVTSVISACEIRYGLLRLTLGKRRANLETLAAQYLATIPCLPVTIQVSETYAQIRRQMEQAGLRIDDNDLWIAATALVNKATLVSRDQDLARIPDLSVEDWTI